jgi:hypothetical protein
MLLNTKREAGTFIDQEINILARRCYLRNACKHFCFCLIQQAVKENVSLLPGKPSFIRQKQHWTRSERNRAISRAGLGSS